MSMDDIEKRLSKIGGMIADSAELSQKAIEAAIKAQREVEELYLLLGKVNAK